MKLNELQSKLARELGELDDETEKEIENDEDEDENEELPDPDEIKSPIRKEASPRRKAIEYRSTARRTKGKVFYMYYDLDYKDMADYLRNEVPGVTWTIPKTRRIFRAIRKYVGFSDPRRDKLTNNK
jgi:hypothetical protein